MPDAPSFGKIYTKGVKPMHDIRAKIDAVLDKITSPELLRRIYRFAQYIYIHVQK